MPLYHLNNPRKLSILLNFIFLISFNSAVLGQFKTVSTCGYNVTAKFKILAIVPSTYNCINGYNYNISFHYSIIINGVNKCYDDSIGIQPQIICNSQNNGYYTIRLPAPTKGNAAYSMTYTGTLTTTTNPFLSTKDCNTSTPSSLGCNYLVMTIFGPGIANTTYHLNILPVELLYFKGDCDGNDIDLNWGTASEINNDFFTIEKSRDALVWSEFTKVNGAKNSLSKLTYHSTDPEPYYGISYYRLKQTDTNGSYKYSDIIAVESCESEIIEEIRLYPNPASEKLSLLLNHETEADCAILIYNQLGHEVFASRKFIPVIDLTNFPAGVYTVRFYNNSTTINKKLVIEKNGSL